jgi:hypothetical protein
MTEMHAGFRSQVVSHTEEFSLAAGIERVFHLFSPEGEKLWAPGWDYINIIGSIELGQDYAFLTDTHDHRSARAIWIISDYDPDNQHVSYYKIEPDQKIGKITVRCFRQSPTSTRVKVTYKYIGLSDSGNLFVQGFAKEAYTEFIGEWRSQLHDYLEQNP